MLGRYHVLDQIGRNAVGPLYLARLEGPKGFQRWAAIRRVDKTHLATPGYTQRFFERVRAGAKLLHPSVTALFDVGEEEGTPWVAMEYLHGERIEEAIGRLEIADTPASWEIAARVIADAAEGLHAVHDLRDKEGAPLGLLHGDLAPHSLVVTYEGKTKIKGAFEPRAHGVLDPRKVPYAAPEQLFDGIVDARADVFALGVLLWELLAGKRLFARRTDDETRAMIEAGVVPPLSEIVDEAPRELDVLVRAALARNPSQRIASARELSRELESLLVAKGVVARDDDVGRYMRTLFADRYTESESRLQAAADVTEIFRRSQQLPSARAIVAIPDVSVKDEEDDAEATELMELPDPEEDRTTAERPAARPSPPRREKGISGYTDEVLADSGPTNPRNQLPADTDEVRTLTAPQPKLEIDPVTLTAPKIDANVVSSARLIMPSSLSEPDETESAIFVAPRSRAPTPPDPNSIVTPPPRPAMASFPDRPLLPSTPQAGVPHAPTTSDRMRPTEPPAWPAPPPAFAAATPYSGPGARGQHAALSTQSLRGVLFPHDRAKRFAIVSIVGSLGGAVLFLVFFAVWRSYDEAAARTAAASSSVTAQTPSASASQKSSATLPTIAPIPTMDLSQPSATNAATTITTGRHHVVAPIHTHEAPIAPSGKIGFLTVMCKPSCDHVIDGARDYGGTPLLHQELSAGKHALVLRVDQTHTQKTVTVEVPNDDTISIRPDMSP
jgi:serine/threonine-protein kinase